MRWVKIDTTLYPELKFYFCPRLPACRHRQQRTSYHGHYAIVPGKTVTEFISFAKAHPGKINVGSPGIGSTPPLCYELLQMTSGIDLVHVPYRGSYIPDLISLQVQVALREDFAAAEVTAEPLAAENGSPAEAAPSL